LLRLRHCAWVVSRFLRLGRCSRRLGEGWPASRAAAPDSVKAHHCHESPGQDEKSSHRARHHRCIKAHAEMKGTARLRMCRRRLAAACKSRAVQQHPRREGRCVKLDAREDAVPGGECRGVRCELSLVGLGIQRSDQVGQPGSGPGTWPLAYGLSSAQRSISRCAEQPSRAPKPASTRTRPHLTPSASLPPISTPHGRYLGQHIATLLHHGLTQGYASPRPQYVDPLLPMLPANSYSSSRPLSASPFVACHVLT
jgi:hypothetical protein